MTTLSLAEAARILGDYVEAVQTVLAVYSSPSDQPKDFEAMHSVLCQMLDDPEVLACQAAIANHHGNVIVAVEPGGALLVLQVSPN